MRTLKWSRSGAFQKCAGGSKGALFPAARMLALLEGAAS